MVFLALSRLAWFCFGLIPFWNHLKVSLFHLENPKVSDKGLQKYQSDCWGANQPTSTEIKRAMLDYDASQFCDQKHFC